MLPKSLPLPAHDRSVLPAYELAIDAASRLSQSEPSPPAAAATSRVARRAEQSSASRSATVMRPQLIAPPNWSLPRLRPQTIRRYEILGVLGHGAMGLTYKARDPDLDRIVAIKTFMSPRGASKRILASYIERFQRESKVVAKLQHPTIVTIFDAGVEDELPFMVFEYLPGETLADRLDRVRLPLGRAVQIAFDLARALDVAHRRQIVHRDVKPANVLNDGAERWKLMDFGLARLPNSMLTDTGTFLGTPGYTAPEAIIHGRYMPQTDVFAWGVVLYELLSGTIPYASEDVRMINQAVLAGNPPSPRAYDPSIPEPLAAVALTALNASEAERYRHGGEAAQALREAWELCLATGLASPTSLTAAEVPHSVITGPMHAVSAAAVLADATRVEMTSGTGTSAAVAPVDVIDSESALDDDEPTSKWSRSLGDSSFAPGVTSQLSSRSTVPAMTGSRRHRPGIADAAMVAAGNAAIVQPRSPLAMPSWLPSARNTAEARCADSRDNRNHAALTTGTGSLWLTAGFAAMMMIVAISLLLYMGTH